jgi:hypothetical protein
MDALDYWRDIATRSQAEVWAACRAVGSAGFYLGPYGPDDDRERLARLREVIADLRTDLGLDDIDGPANSPETTDGREF